MAQHDEVRASPRECSRRDGESRDRHAAFLCLFGAFGVIADQVLKTLSWTKEDADVVHKRNVRWATTHVRGHEPRVSADRRRGRTERRWTARAIWCRCRCDPTVG